MRLPVVATGHRRRQRIALRVLRLVGRTDPDPVIVSALYRPELFGRGFMQLAKAAMRGQSEWTDGERELFGAFVSRLNQCRFCSGIHSGMAERSKAGELIAQLDRWEDGTLPDRLVVTLRLLQTVTLRPDQVGPEDIQAVRDAGLSDQAIKDALYVATLFNTINRIANSLDFGWETEADRLKLVAGLHRSGYNLPAFILR